MIAEYHDANSPRADHPALPDRCSLALISLASICPNNALSSRGIASNGPLNSLAAPVHESGHTK
jgi:hypothetical protein